MTDIKNHDERFPPPANDNCGAKYQPLDPHIRVLAQIIGRQLARDHAKEHSPSNDNSLDV